MLTAVSPPQPTPRTSKGQKETVSSPLTQEIASFEEAARQMLRRMEVMLVTVKGVSSEKDPGRRLEVRQTTLSVHVSNSFLLRPVNLPCRDY